MKLSVALCTFNGELYLRAQIDSILKQSLSIDEIIICDDNSSDGTWAILQAYHILDPVKIVIYKNKENIGSIKNFQNALSRCTGDLIFLCDQDDVWLNEKVEHYVNYFEDNSKINVLCSNGYVINENNKTLEVLTIWDTPTILQKSNEKIDYFHSIAYCGNIATGASMAIRKDFLQLCTPFPSATNIHHDEWIALIASIYGVFKLIPEKLFFYRLHQGQQVGSISYPIEANSEKKITSRFSKTDKSLSSLKRRVRKARLTYKNLQLWTNKNDKSAILDQILNYYKMINRELINHHPILGRFFIIFGNNTFNKIINKLN